MDFSNRLIRWYGQNKRDLPWRKTTNPYFIWVSEIILQQTRVDQGLSYYKRFIKTFPSVELLASSHEDEVLKIWQGLGYYSRARNMHFTAKEIVNNQNGVFPKDYHQLLQLKGIGEYTASAIVSFAYNYPYAVVDGNVVRVLSRVFGLKIEFYSAAGKKQFAKLAQDLILIDNAAEYNQSIMEFGALQCKVKNPNCCVCIMKTICFAYKNQQVEMLPLKSRKIKIKHRFLIFFMIKTSKGVLISKRLSGIWKGLYEFPYFECSAEIFNSNIINSLEWKSFFKDKLYKIDLFSNYFVHNLSHQRINARFYVVRSNDFYIKDFILVDENKISKYPVSILMQKFLKTLESK